MTFKLAFSTLACPDWVSRAWHPELDYPDVTLPHEIAMLRDWLGEI